jgi:predicted RecA/RadA family phage recombinase
MSKNCVFPGARPAVSLPVPSGTKAGQPVKVGNFIGVCETDRNENDGLDRSGNPTGYASVAVDGCYSLPVPEAVASVGLPIYITSGNALTTTVGSNTYFGKTRPVIDKGVATGATKSADGGTAGYVNVQIG